MYSASLDTCEVGGPRGDPFPWLGAPIGERLRFAFYPPLLLLVRRARVLPCSSGTLLRVC